MQVPDNRHNAIHVMSAFEARQWQVRTLFVCGMTARDYPRASGYNLLFPDAEIDRLRKAGIPLRTAAEDDRDEEMLFDSLKTRASDNLILSVSTHDSGGRTIVPSARFTDPVHIGTRDLRTSATTISRATPHSRRSPATSRNRFWPGSPRSTQP